MFDFSKKHRDHVNYCDCRTIKIVWLAIFLALTGSNFMPKGGLIVEGAEGRANIKVGILHSLTGTMAISERAVVDAVMLAINEINQQGGLLGRELNPVVADGKSDSKTFEKEALRLIVNEKVSVVFGCWTSAHRKKVKPIFARYDHLLFYPVQYEGIEQSANIVYTGATPNQQIVPAIKWCFENIGKRFFLAGSDYIFPRIANTIAKDYINALGGEIVGEEYLLLGAGDAGEIVSKIIAAKPDIVLNTINGSSNLVFFTQMRDAGIGSDTIPTMSFSIGENEIEKIGVEKVAGNYACWNYFQSIKSDDNRRFVESFKKAHGESRVISDPMEAAYFGVKLWAKAVKGSGSSEPRLVRQYLKRQGIVAPQGIVHFNHENNHMLKYARVGRVRDDGQFEILWTSNEIVRPRPYLVHRSKREWDQMVRGFYKSWGKKWSAPNPETTE